jgi:deazaflavin-dependent oxidoreductase (nitroreductase family)
MTEAKLAPNLPGWMLEHTNRYLSSGGTDGHMYKVTPPGYTEMTVPSLLLTTTGRKSGDKYIFPLFYGKTGDSYIVVASKGGAPQHPGWYRNILANPDVEVQVGTLKTKARARTATGEERTRLWKTALGFGRLMPTTRRRRSARSPWSCWIPSAKRGSFRYRPRWPGVMTRP